MSDLLLKHYGNIANGELFLNNIDLYMENLQALEEKQVELIIQERHEQTSVNEHGFYRGGIIKVALQHECFGRWSKDELHTYLTDRFLGETVEKEIRGVITSVRMIPSTANIGKKKMAKFITDVIYWLSTIGIEIKDPESYSIQKYYESKK